MPREHCGLFFLDTVYMRHNGQLLRRTDRQTDDIMIPISDHIV